MQSSRLSNAISKTTEGLNPIPWSHRGNMAKAKTKGFAVNFLNKQKEPQMFEREATIVLRLLT